MSITTSKRLGGLARIAARQHGVVSFAQAAAAGLDRRALRSACEAGLVERLHPQVYRFAGSERTSRAEIWAAVLQVPGAVATHESALRLQGIDRIPRITAVTVEPDAPHVHVGIRVHRAQDLLDEHLVTIDGLPTTTIERAVIDVASVFTASRLEYLLDRVTVQDRSTTIGAVGRALRQVNRRGRLHIARLGPLLDARSPAEPAPRSRLERRADALLATSGLPVPAHEHPLPTSTGFPGYVDRAWPDAMLILEIDGRTWHAREAAMARDRARDREAAGVGWQTIRVLDEEVRDCPDAVLADVVATHRVRTGQLRRAG